MKQPPSAQLQVTKNLLQHGRSLGQHLIVPEAQYRKSRFPQHLTTRGIPRGLLQMLPTIQLDDQPSLQTSKIGEVSSDRHLPTKLMTVQAPVPEVAPKMPFSIGLGSTQAARTLRGGRIGTSHGGPPQGLWINLANIIGKIAPHPALSPLAGRGLKSKDQIPQGRGSCAYPHTVVKSVALRRDDKKELVSPHGHHERDERPHLPISALAPLHSGREKALEGVARRRSELRRRDPSPARRSPSFQQRLSPSPRWRGEGWGEGPRRLDAVEWVEEASYPYPAGLTRLPR